jgi:hypothetical protein
MQMKNQEIEENNNYRQGRTEEKQQENEMMASWAFGALFVMVLGIVFCNLIGELVKQIGL